MYRNYKSPFRRSGQSILACSRPLFGSVCALLRRLFKAWPIGWMKPGIFSSKASVVGRLRNVLPAKSGGTGSDGGSQYAALRRSPTLVGMGMEEMYGLKGD